MKTTKTTHGFSIIEVTVSTILLSVLIAASANAIARDTSAHRALTAQLGPEIRAQYALERIATELRMAGEFGEDRDEGADFDDGEDTNGNGVLDSDWNVPDGATNLDRIEFNRRVDLKDEDGNTITSGVYSRRIAYFIEDGTLVREWDVTAPDGSTETRRTIMVEKVVDMRISRTGLLVRVELDAILPTEIYAPGRRTYETRIWLRN